MRQDHAGDRATARQRERRFEGMDVIDAIEITPAYPPYGATLSSPGWAAVCPPCRCPPPNSTELPVAMVVLNGFGGTGIGVSSFAVQRPVAHPCEVGWPGAGSRDPESGVERVKGASVHILK